LKKNLIIILLLTASITQAQNWEWVKLIQPNDNKAYMGAQVGTDGKIYAAGNFNTAINFGNSQSLSGNWDGFVAQFDTAGACQWAKKIYVVTQGCGCTVQGNTSYAAVAGTDSYGNVIVYGGYCGCSEAFGSGITSNVPGYNLFLAKYSPTGVCQWVQTKPGSWNSSTGQTDDEIYAVTIDASDNIYISMFNYATNTTFCGLNFANQGSYIFKISTNGVGIWNKQTGSLTGGYTIAQMENINKRIYSYSGFIGTCAFGTTTLTAQGSLDVAVLKMDTAGNYLAAADIGSPGNQTGAYALAISNNRVVLLANNYASSVIVGTYTLNTSTSMDKTFLVAYDTTGLTVQAARNTATDNNGAGSGLYSDNKGNMYLLAHNSATTGFGALSSVPAGRHVIRMDNTLTNYWYMESVGSCVAPDTLGNIYILDAFTTSANYGSSLSETATNGITLGKIHNARTTGIDEGRMAAQTNTMQIYPNPSSSLFNLKLSTNIKSNNAKITLYDISGRLVSDNIAFTKQDENTLQINLSTFAEGNYIIKAEVDNVLYSAKLER